MNPRIPPGRFKDLGPINWGIWRVLSKAAGAPDAHLFSTLGRTGGLFRGWLHYSGSLMPGGKISRHDTELIILRVAHLRDCGYEMDHHIRLGRKAGIDAEELARIIEGPGASELSPRHRAILTAVDELVTTKDVTDDRERLGDLVDLDVIHLQCHLGLDTISLSRLGRASSWRR